MQAGAGIRRAGGLVRGRIRSFFFRSGSDKHAIGSSSGKFMRLKEIGEEVDEEAMETRTAKRVKKSGEEIGAESMANNSGKFTRLKRSEEIHSPASAPGSESVVAPDEEPSSCWTEWKDYFAEFCSFFPACVVLLVVIFLAIIFIFYISTLPTLPDYSIGNSTISTFSLRALHRQREDEAVRPRVMKLRISPLTFSVYNPSRYAVLEHPKGTLDVMIQEQKVGSMNVSAFNLSPHKTAVMQLELPEREARFLDRKALNITKEFLSPSVEMKIKGSSRVRYTVARMHLFPSMISNVRCSLTVASPPNVTVLASHCNN